MNGQLEFFTGSAVSIGARKPRTPGPKEAPEGHARFLGHCPIPKCKTCRAFNVPVKTEERDATPPFGFNQWPNDQRDRWRAEFGKYKVQVAIRAALPPETCPAHKLPLSWRAVEGRISEGTKCDPRCTGARGPQCDCQCAGANHGSDYL